MASNDVLSAIASNITQQVARSAPTLPRPQQVSPNATIRSAQELTPKTTAPTPTRTSAVASPASRVNALA